MINLNLQIGDPEVVRDNFYKVQKALETGTGPDHFLGLYTSLTALQTAHPTATPGDYAQVDPGPGTDVMNYLWDEDEGWVQGGSGLPDEEDIEGTALQNSTASGTVTLDLATFIDFRLTLTGNTTIAVGNTPASGKSFVRNLTIIASGTQTLTFPAGWKIYGDYYPSGVRNKITIIFSNFPVAGLEVDCFISQPN